MNVLNIFSEIGGFSLGLERAEMQIIAFCEIEDFLRQALANISIVRDIHNDVATVLFLRYS